MELKARKRTHDILSGIDELLEDTRKTSAKMAFENLLPLHEDEELIGEFWLKYNRTPYIYGEDLRPDAVGVPHNGSQNPHPACGMACDCYVEKTKLYFQPILEAEYEMTEEIDEWGDPRYIQTWTPNNLDALSCSVEFFGDDELVMIELEYGYDAVPITDLENLCSALEDYEYTEKEI